MSKKDVLLPFEKNPFVLAYQNLAFPMGIIQSNTHDDITPWLASKYINCRYHRRNVFDICITDNWFCVDSKLFFQRINLSKDSYSNLSIDYIDLMRKIISSDCYPYGMYNEQWIHGKASHKKSYFLHDFLLIGYSDEKQVFYSVGYLSDGKFQRFEIPYGSMRKALGSIKEQNVSFCLFKFNPESPYIFNKEIFIQELYDYINSTTSVKVFRVDIYFGMQAICEMAKDFLIDAEQKQRIDNRYLRALMEHKFLMVKRIQYLNNQFDLDLSAIKKSAIQVHKMGETIHLLGIKYSITREFSIANRIVELIDKMLILEAEYLPLLYDRVKNAQEDGVL